MIGAGKTINEATIARDHHVLDTILTNLPEGLKGKNLRVLELGSGRGGMGRYMCLHMKKKGILEQFVATNISQVENTFNAETGKK